MKSRVKRSTLFVGLSLMVAGSVSAQDTSAPAFDLTGEWIFTVESPNGTGERQVTFRQEGNKLTGEIASSRASGDLEGMIEGNIVTFVASVFMDSGAFDVTYMAKYVDGQLREGVVDFGDYGAGSFMGQRKPKGGGGDTAKRPGSRPRR